MLISLFYLNLFFVNNFAVSATPEEPVSFTAGVTAYQQQDYQKAQEVFQKLLTDQPENPALLYNLGLAEYKLERWGLAVGLWRKAYDIDPGYSAAEAAIAYAEATHFPRQSPQSIFGTIYKTFLSFPLIFWLVTTSASLFLVSWFSIDYGAKRKTPFLQWPIGLHFLIPVALVTALITAKVVADRSQIKATVVQRDLKTHAAPSETSPTLTELFEGQIVIVKRTTGKWAQVRAAGGNPGWVPQTSLIAFGGL